MEFFNLDNLGEEPDKAGVEVDIDDVVEEWDDGESATGLPGNVKIIRFYNSW